MRTLISLELRQRLGLAWLVVQALWVAALGALTAGAFFTLESSEIDVNRWLYSAILVLALALAAVIIPSLGGGSVNGDRDRGILPLIQLTRVSASGIIWSRTIAAWIVGLTFLATASPFLAFAAIQSRTDWMTLAGSLAALLAEIAFFSAIGVACSAVIRRPQFSVLAASLIVSTLCLGTVAAYAIATALTTTTSTVTVSVPAATGAVENDGTDTNDAASPQPACTQRQEQRTTARTDLTWPLLAANPFVIAADAVPLNFDASGQPVDTFSTVKLLLRQAQAGPQHTSGVIDECTSKGTSSAVAPSERPRGQQPIWFWGLGAQAAIALLLLGWATAATRIPRR